MPARTIAIGDIHGCARALEAVLAAVDPGPGDTVVTLGDYVNRGPDTRAVLDTLIRLSRRARLVPILGNHDEMLLHALVGESARLAWREMGGDATLRSYGAGADVGDIPEEHVAFLRGCRESFETGTHLFVHAQYLPDRPLAGQPPHVLRWSSLRDHVPAPHASGKRAIAGHTSQKDGEILDLGHIVCIDTYCYGGKWLTAMDVDTRQVWQANAKGSPRGRRPKGPADRAGGRQG